jgi:hypothetical protein
MMFRAVSSLMMEAVRTSETSVDNHSTRQYNPEDSSEQQETSLSTNNTILITSAILIKIVGSVMHRVTQNLVRMVGGYGDARERRFWNAIPACVLEKELLERHSGTFSHKNTPAYY